MNRGNYCQWPVSDRACVNPANHEPGDGGFACVPFRMCGQHHQIWEQWCDTPKVYDKTAELRRRVTSELRDIPALARLARLDSLAKGDSQDVAFDDVLDALRRDLDRAVTAVEIAADDLERRARAYERAHDKAADTLMSIAREDIGAAFDCRGFFVYCLWGDNESTPLYVGQSTNVLSRLGSHLGDAKKRAHVRRVTLIRCTSKKVMDTTESHLIAQYSPSWNIVGNYNREHVA